MEPVAREAATCVRCRALAETRTQVVFDAGSADADLMIAGEAPGRAEDELGVPFAGPAADLLDELLAGIGLTRSDAYLTTVVKCRPPGNRDPLPEELVNCGDWLHQQLESVRPKLVCALGGGATRALRGEPASIRAVHGRSEVRVVGTRAIRLLPLFHPAAALYQGDLLDVLRADFAQIPDLLALPEPDQPPPATKGPDPFVAPDEPSDGEGQLGLF